MKKKTLIFLILFNLIFIMQLFKNNVYASEISVNDDFDDNTILAVLGKEESISFKEYTPNDFSEINCKEVEDLTYIYQKKIDKQKEDFINKINMDNPLKVNVDTFRRILKITISNNGKENVIDAINKLKLRNDLESVSANYYMEPYSASFNDTYSDKQWALEKIQLQEAWEEMGNNQSIVKVGIIDSGIDGTHPDLANRVDRTLSKCFGGTYTNPLEDLTGHGTAVASIIGAQGNNTIGIVGVCKEVSLVSLRVANTSGNFSSDGIIEAITYATEYDIPILNFSGGTYDYDEDTVVREQAIKNYPGLFVCAAGNDSQNTSEENFHYPSDHKLNHLISVGASGDNDRRWFDGSGPNEGSNFGKTSVDLFAPGKYIFLCHPVSLCQTGLCENETTLHFSEGYHYRNGSSFATPYVTGVAALLLSKYPNMTPSEIKGTIMNNVDKMSAFSPICVSGGRLNAYKALINPHTHTFTYTSKNNVSYHDRVCTTCYYYTESDIHFETVGYQWLNLTTHTMLCECGDLIESNHVVSSDAYNSGASIAPCLLCGGNATIGFIEIQNNILKISENGSFILSNGLVVLVDKDIEAYMNGTLIFRNNDEDVI